MTPTGRHADVGPLAPATVAALQYVAHHRLLTTQQVHALREPGSSERWTQHLLAGLERRGLVGHAAAHGRLKLWHATRRGIELARSTGVAGRERALGPEEASGALHAHTLAVNDAGICFLRAARRRGDDFGPFSWRHEVAHPLTRGHSRLISDALLTYLYSDGDGSSLEYRLLELDRATLTVERLAAKLARYADLHSARNRGGVPRWRAWYPAFPAVHVVLAHRDRPALERRRDTVVALCDTDPHLARTPGLAVSICLLDDLQAYGPFAPIFYPLAGHDRPVDWLGEPGGAMSDDDRARR